MTLVLGKGRGLSIVVDRTVADACTDVQAQLAERAEFYRGSDAVVALGERTPTGDEMIALRDVLAAYDVRLAGVSGPSALEGVAAAAGVAYLGPTAQSAVAPMPRSRAPRAVELSESARSLVADFAGARADLAKRREAREESAAARAQAVAPVVASGRAAAPTAPGGVMYHRGTLRGGQSLQFVGDLVIVGDVNPGAEVTASGDIVVFGALRGVAHAGAQGLTTARVVALELEPTQLRIATSIAADPGTRRGPARGPEHASIIGGRIIVVPHAKADFAPRELRP
jgi:septum site-determining protein MinC